MNEVMSFIAMAAPGGATQSQQSPIFMFGWIILMLGIFYFLMIRPQQRREKARRAMIDAVKSGDKIVFSGGLLGVVTNVKDKTLTVKLADNVKVEILRGAVSRVLDKGEQPDDADTCQRS